MYLTIFFHKYSHELLHQPLRGCKGQVVKVLVEFRLQMEIETKNSSIDSIPYTSLTIY